MNSIDSITVSHTSTFFVVGHYTINMGNPAMEGPWLCLP